MGPISPRVWRREHSPIPACWLRRAALETEGAITASGGPISVLGRLPDFRRTRAASMLWFIDCPSGSPSFSPVAIECARCESRRSPRVGRLEGVAIGENPPPQLPRPDGARRVQRLRLCLSPADDLHRSRRRSGWRENSHRGGAAARLAGPRRAAASRLRGGIQDRALGHRAVPAGGLCRFQWKGSAWRVGEDDS